MTCWRPWPSRTPLSRRSATGLGAWRLRTMRRPHATEFRSRHKRHGCHRTACVQQCYPGSAHASFNGDAHVNDSCMAAARNRQTAAEMHAAHDAKWPLCAVCYTEVSDIWIRDCLPYYHASTQQQRFSRLANTQPTNVIWTPLSPATELSVQPLGLVAAYDHCSHSCRQARPGP